MLTVGSFAVTHITGQAAKSPVHHTFTSCYFDYCNVLLYGIALVNAVIAECQCEDGQWLVENGPHHTDPEISVLVTDTATGDLQACNSGAQMP